MEIEILEQQCGGTEFVPRPHRLHLGAQNVNPEILQSHPV